MRKKYLHLPALLAAALFVGVAFDFSGSFISAVAQSVVSGDIVGTVKDSTGAVVPNATITATNTSTGDVKTATSSGAGDYRVQFLKPGAYVISIKATGFESVSLSTSVSAGAVSNADVKLTVGKASTVVEVTESAPMLNTENAEVSTTFNLDQVQSLPNPGNDLTFIAQTAPGSVMNTFGGYGNFSNFGMPATSNTFTVNGGYENDPFLNLNNSGATNLLLGNNDVDSVTVTTNAYGAQFGGLGGAQVNEISRSGGNTVHGNLGYWWNGRVMNAADYFVKQAGGTRAFDNANQWAAAIGGPIKRDKTFFFINTEGLRVLIPGTSVVSAPSPDFISCSTTNNAAACHRSTLDVNGYGPTPAKNMAFLTNLYKIYTSNANYATAIPDPNDPYAVLWQANTTSFGEEWLITGRIDHSFSDTDHLFVHYKQDKGVQPTYIDPLSPVFSAASPQPEYEGQLNETHTFTPNLINQFVLAGIYYRAIFTNTNSATANALSPFTFESADGDFANLGGIDYDFPQGRNVTGYQVIDDLSWVKGKNNIKVGWNIRRDDVTDYDPQVEASVPVTVMTEEALAVGAMDYEWIQRFPQRLTQPIALYDMGGYVQDAWKLAPNLTLTGSLRLEHNSNPTCLTSCFANLAADVYSTPTTTTTPYNQIISYGRRAAFTNLQKVGYQPRFSVAWSPKGSGSNLVVRAGFGLFNDSFPATIADTQLGNAPTRVGFTVLGVAASGSAPFYDLNPALSSSAYASAVASNAAFVSGFAGGASYSSLVAKGIGFSAPSFTNTAPKIFYPTYEEYNLYVDYQVTHSTALSLGYVGNHGYHEPVSNGSVNAHLASSSSTLFPTLPHTSPYAMFGTLTNVFSGANSNFNGLAANVKHSGKGLTLIFNYEFSHTLDEISNGGLLAFGLNSNSPDNPNTALLSKQYGNADYDVRQNITAGFVYKVPRVWGPELVTGGWEINGTFFHNTGFPFSVQQTSSSVTKIKGGSGISNYGGNLYARQSAPISNDRCSGSSHIFNPYGTAGNVPCDFVNDFVTAPTSGPSATDFNQQARNQIHGPGYTDLDLALFKGFNFPMFGEKAQLKVGAQLFNSLNHPNFSLPNNSISAGPLGMISSVVSTPTSILGAFLGGDASPRLVELTAKFSF